MPRFKKLRNNLYSASLFYGKIETKPSHYFSCFFIVQHTDDMEYIKDQAIQLLLSGCRDFYFYGEKETLWHLGFDEVDTFLFPYSTAETVAQTVGYDNLGEFVEALHDAISTRGIIPLDCYLIYDDTEIYHDVLHRLEVLYH